MIEWSTSGGPDQREDELRAVIESPFEYPEDLHHVLGFVYPDGTVLTWSARLKSMDWWPEYVRAAWRGIAAVPVDQRDDPEAVFKTELPDEALAA